MDNAIYIGLGISIVVVFLLRYLIVSARDYSFKMISSMVKTNPQLALERLDNNKLFRYTFRKELLSIFRLDCYMALGNIENAKKEIDFLSNRKLNDHDKYDYLTKSFSFYLTNNYLKEAESIYEMTTSFLKEKKIIDKDPYSNIINEMEILVGVYVKKDVNLIDRLTLMREKTQKKYDRGLIEYRLAKLYYFKGDNKKMNEFLKFAENNLKDTAYSLIIKEAFKNPGILEVK